MTGETKLTDAQRRDLWREMRVPTFAFAALLLFLGGIVLLGSLAPSRISSGLEFALLVCMALTVLLFSMEVRDEKPLTRFFSAFGFIWVGVLVSLLMVDYLTR